MSNLQIKLHFAFGFVNVQTKYIFSLLSTIQYLMRFKVKNLSFQRTYIWETENSIKYLI